MYKPLTVKELLAFLQKQIEEGKGDYVILSFAGEYVAGIVETLQLGVNERAKAIEIGPDEDWHNQEEYE